MKTFILSVLLLLTAGFGASLHAQDADARTVKTQIIEASADDVWEIVRDLDGLADISKFVARVEYTGANDVGGQRVCYAPKGQGSYTEAIIGFDDTARTYTYAVKEGVPVAGMVNSFKVVDLGYRKSMLVWTSTYDEFVDNPNMTEEQFAGFIDMAISDMIANITAKARA